MDFIKKTFAGGVRIDIKDEGGQECYDFMTMEYRVIVNVIMTVGYLSIIYYNLPTWKKVADDLMERNKGHLSPSLIEKAFGCMSILLVFALFCFKSHSNQLVFWFNPCHQILFIQGIVLLSELNFRNAVLYNIVINSTFSPYLGMMFPNTVGLDYPFEVEVFWLEHAFGAIVNPIVFSLGGRYDYSISLSFKNHIISHCFFGLYQRNWLFPLSFMFTVNVNSTLCSQTIDPFAKYLDKWYYILSDYYIFFMGIYTNLVMKIILSFVAFFKKAIGIDQNNRSPFSDELLDGNISDEIISEKAAKKVK